MFRLTLELSPEFKAQFEPVKAQLLAALQLKLAPYDVEWRSLDHSLELSGDEPAVLILKSVVQSSAEAWTEGQSPAEIWATDRLNNSFDDVLKRELAFRLAGLRNAVRPLSAIQHAFMSCLLESKPAIVIGAGPTGTGKTHLAIAAGLNHVETGKFRHLIIARPHVFEPGETVTASARRDVDYDDQFAAIEDELFDLISPDEVRRLQEAKRLEIMPIGRMRGRTFQNAFIVIDEAQNMDIRRMRMAVTRLGQGSRVVLTGDPSHVAIRDTGPSGLEHLMDMIADRDLAKIFRFTPRQIIRNPVVAELEDLYTASLGSESGLS